MNADLFDELFKKAPDESAADSPDYIGDDGILRCGICSEPKACKRTILGKDLILPVMCSCDVEKNAEFEKRMKLEQIERRRREAFGKSKKINCTFSIDDKPESVQSVFARKYAANFARIKKWLVFFGSTGTGKSFLAACIVNCVIDSGFTAHFVKMSEVARHLWDAAYKEEVFTRLCRYDLLVIDDFGSENDTNYMNSMVFDLIDSRYEAEKNTIITTNLSIENFKKPKDLNQQRIFSRLNEMSIFQIFKGSDRRGDKMNETMLEERRKLLEMPDEPKDK